MSLAGPSQETEYKILFADANIYVAIRAHDTKPDKIDLRPAERDGFKGDVVGLTTDFTMRQLWDIYPTDILMLKLNYWFSL